MASDRSLLEVTWFIAAVALVGLSNSVLLVFAFAAPRWYLERLARHEPASI